MTRADDDRLVRLTLAESELDALFWQAMLQQEGIDCLVRRRDALAAYGAGVGLPYSYEVLVLARDAARAREVLGLPEDGD